MKVILFFAALYATSGPGAEQPVGYETMEQCEKVRAGIPAVVEEYNAKAGADKALAFVAICAPMQRAKQGKGV